MKRLLLCISLAVIVSTFAFAQTKKESGKRPDAKVEKEIVQIEQELSNALLKGDVTPYERYFADTCTFIGTEGEVLNKAGLIAFLKDLKYETFTFDETKVQLFGNMAVVTFRSTEKLTFKGASISGHNRWIDVFVKLGGHWKIVTEQGTPIKEQ